MKKDLNYVAALEKAIAKKYGKETIVNPKANWDDEKEEEYAEQRKRLYEKGEFSETGKRWIFTTKAPN